MKFLEGITLSILGGIVGAFAKSFFINGKLEIVDMIAIVVCSLGILIIVLKKEKQ